MNPPKVLIVDDKVENLLVLRQILEELKIEVIEATNGNSALAATLSHDFSLAILDVYMPDMDGYELTELLRGDEKTANMPIIFLTAAYDDEAQVFKGYQSGGVDYIVKPYKSEILLAKVKIFLELRQARDDLAEKILELDKSRQELEQRVVERTWELNKRIIELESLYAIQRILSEPALHLDTALHEVVKMIPPSLRFPDLAAARLTLGESIFSTEGFRETPWIFSCGIPVSDLTVSTLETARKNKSSIFLLETCYLEDNSNFGADPFPGEERNLLANIAQLIGTAVERNCANQEREKLQTQFNQAQKLESVGRLAGGVAHDFNNMLSVIIGHAEMAMTVTDPTSQAYDDLEEILRTSQRSTDLTRQLLAFARKDVVTPIALNLNQIAEGTLKMIHRLIGENIDLLWQPATDLWTVWIDPGQVDQILANLCVNARDAIDGVGVISIRTGNISVDEPESIGVSGMCAGDYACLSVTDSGCGMTQETIEHIFDPFFTTKAQEKGTGLGLSTVFGIVRQHKGFIGVSSLPGQGSTFTVYLPRYLAQAGTEPELSHGFNRFPEQAIQANGGNETILLAENEPAILTMLTMILEFNGYSVIPASSPGEALSIAKERGEMIQLLVTDIIMPGMNGQDLYAMVRKDNPHIRCLFMSGHGDIIATESDSGDEASKFISKPFSMQSLVAKVRELLD